MTRRTAKTGAGSEERAQADRIIKGLSGVIDPKE